MFSAIWNALCDFGSWLIDALTYLFESFFMWIWDTIQALFGEQLNPIIEALQFEHPALSVITEVAYWANTWVDLQLALTLFTAYCVLQISVITLNWVLGLIPGIN